MRILAMLRERWRALFRRSRFEWEMEEEIAHFLELSTARHIDRGLDPAEARRLAHRDLGGVERVKEETRRERAFRPLADLITDIRHSARSLRRHPGFTAIAVLSLAIGIGVSTAFFTVNYAVWMEPVSGVNGTDRIVEVLITREGRGDPYWTCPDLQDLKEAGTPIELLAGWKGREGSITTDGSSMMINIMYVSVDYFRVLGVVPEAGRDFLPTEDVRPGGHPVAVLSHELWTEQFEADPDIIGRTLTVNRTPYTVVGVVPAAFRGLRRSGTAPDLWAPLMQHPYIQGEDSLLMDRGASWVQVLGRLRDGASVEEASAALRTVFARLAQDHPATNENRSARASSFGPIPAEHRTDMMIGLSALFALVAVVLLIICGNVSGMVLVRGATRARELAVRMTLGSGRGRLVRHLMVEALLLAAAGGAMGVLLTFWALRVIPAAAVTDNPTVTFKPNVPVLLFSLAVTLAATLAVGLLPAIRSSRPELSASLKDDAGVGGRRVGRVQRIAASAQTGVALALLIVCGLFVRALDASGRKDPGFEPRQLLVARLDLSSAGYESFEAAGVLLDRLRGSVGSLPGVVSVTTSDGIPLDQIGNYTTVRRADQPEGTGEGVRVEFTGATEDFFETIGTPILRGRGLAQADNLSGEPVAVITVSLAERLWPGEDALGKWISFSLRMGETRAHRIVGITGHVASSREAEDWPQLFYPLRQSWYPRIMIAARTAVDPATLVRPIQSAILQVQPDLPIAQVVTCEDLVASGTRGQRDAARMTAGLGLLTLLLAAIGIYGVVAFTVANRTREIGLRMALGSTRERVLRTIILDAVRLAAPGLAVGTLLAAGMGAVIRSELIGINPLDPVSFGLGAGVLFLVILLASLVPARRAARIQPVDALRWE